MAGLFKRHDYDPDWEPVPWDSNKMESRLQARGFEQRAMKPIVWRKIDWNNFPAGGIFEQPRAWLVRNDVSYVATFDGEDYLLIDNVWFGWPDPPRWGLATRPKGSRQAEWMRWGHFAELPVSWLFPDDPKGRTPPTPGEG